MMEAGYDTTMTRGSVLKLRGIIRCEAIVLVDVLVVQCKGQNAESGSEEPKAVFDLTPVRAVVIFE
jgi:hypothetical protein